MDSLYQRLLLIRNKVSEKVMNTSQYAHIQDIFNMDMLIKISTNTVLDKLEMRQYV